MSIELTAIIATMIGGLIGSFFSYFATKTESNSEERTQFQKDILSRLQVVEQNYKRLEKEVATWKIRYWSLYASVIKQGVNIPDVHKQSIEELEQDFFENIRNH